RLNNRNYRQEPGERPSYHSLSPTPWCPCQGIGRCTVDSGQTVDSRSVPRSRSRGPIRSPLNRSRFMRGRTSYKRFLGMGVALLLFAGLGMGAKLLLFAGQSQFPASSPRTVHNDDHRDAKVIAADLVTAIRHADRQAIRKLLDNGADVNARDAEG